jgi:plasmid stability protein
MYGVKRTTIYLPDELKARLEAVARREGRTEADVIRDALAQALDGRVRPKPTLPLVPATGRTTNWAEEVDERLADGFGRS